MNRMIFQRKSRIAPHRAADVYHLSDFQTHADNRTLTVMFKREEYC